MGYIIIWGLYRDCIGMYRISGFRDWGSGFEEFD